MFDIKALASAVLPLLALLLIGASQFGHPGVTSIPPGLVYCAGGVLCALCGFGLVVGSRLTRSQSILLLSLQLLLGIGLISSRSSYDPFQSSSALSSWIAAVGLWGAFVTGLQLNHQWDKAAKAFVAIIFVVTLHAVGLFVSQGAYLKGTFTNPDCFSVLPLAAAFVSLGLLSGAKPKERIFLWFLFPWFCSVVALTGSRSGLAGLAVGFTVFAALAWKKDRTKPVVQGSLALFGLALVGLVLLGQSDAFLNKWKTLATGGDRLGITSRLDVIRGSVKLANNRPLVGYGPGVFHLAYQNVRNVPTEAEDYMNVAHNDFMQVWVEMGYTGLVLWLAFMGGCCFTGLKVYREQNDSQRLGCVAAVVAIAVYSLGNFAIPVAADFLVLAFVLALSSSALEDREAPRIGSALLGLGLLAFGLLGSMTGYAVLKNNQALASADGLDKKMDWEAAYAGLDSAAQTGDLRVYNSRARLAERLAFFLADDSWLTRAVENLEKAHKLSSADIRVLVRLASLYEAQGRNDEGLRLLKDARDLARHAPVIEHRIARNLVLQGDAKGAIEVLLAFGGSSDTQAIGELLFVLESQKLGSGVELVEKWSESKRSPGLIEAVRVAGDLAKASKPATARAFYQVALKTRPKDPLLLLRLAEVTADPDERISLLKLAWESPQTSTDANYLLVRRQALLAWADGVMTTKSGNRDAAVRGVVRKLESFLSKSPECTDVRLRLSDYYEKDKRVADARRVLRDGLDRDRSGQVHAHLGALYQRAGSPDIALTYYEEALKLQPQSQALKDLVEKLQSNDAKPEAPDS
jgi:O-antigen ligase/tetratricopeptide (TPR) repeat protein